MNATAPAFETSTELESYVLERLGSVVEGSKVRTFTADAGQPGMEIDFMHASSAAWAFGVLIRDPELYGVTMRHSATYLVHLIVD